MSDDRRRRQLSLLQRVTEGQTVLAGAFADELGVSLRTVYRDVEDLIGHGVPVKGTRGPDGGYSLEDPDAVEPVALQSPESLEAFLNSLDEESGAEGLWRRLEAAAVVADGLADDPLVDLASSRLHFDKSDWYWRAETPSVLPLLRRACFADRAVDVVWTETDGTPKHDVLMPYGLVWKGGHWYLVAAPSTGDPPFRIRLTRIQSAANTPLRFTQPEGFELAKWWDLATHEYGRGRTEVRLRVAPDADEFLQIDLKEDSRLESLGDGWSRVHLFVDKWHWLVPMIAPYGGSVVVEAPAPLRAAVIDLHQQALAAYEGAPHRNKPRKKTDDTRRRASHGRSAN